MNRHAKALLAALMVLVLSMGILTACKDPTPSVKPQAPTMTTSSKTVELGSTADVKFDVNWNNGTFQTIKKGQTTLDKANYSHDDTSVTIKGSYVKGLSVGENKFTLTTDGGSCDFKIMVEDSRPADPTVTPESGSFNIMDPAALIEFTVDWGKGTFTKLEVTGKTLVKDTDYMIEGDKLSIVGIGLLDKWEVGDYTFTLTTTTGKTTFIIKVVSSGARFTDDEVFKVSSDADVSFDMLLGGVNVSAVKADGADSAISSDSYTYDAEAEAFVFKKAYLDTLAAGIHDFRIELDNEIVFNVSIATKTLLADNFENGNTNGNQITFGVVGNSNISDAEAIDGKSVKLDLQSPNIAGTFLEGKDIALQANHLYIFHMTVRIDGKTQLIITVPGTDGNLGWMNADGTLSTSADQTKDSRSTIEKIDENLVQLNIYLPVTNVDSTKQLLLYFRNGDYEHPETPQENTQLIVDNIWIEENTTETFRPASKAELTPAQQQITGVQDVTFTVNNNYGEFVSVTNGEDALTLGDDYTLDGDQLTIKAAYLTEQGLTNGQTLTLSYNTKNPDNEEQTFAAEFSVRMTATVWGSVFEQNFNGTDDVVFDVTMNGATVTSINDGSKNLAEGDYAYADNKLTIKASYLKTLTEKKPYQFIMTDSNEQSFRFVIYVGTTSAETFYANFEDGKLPNVNSFAINMTPQWLESGFDGSGAKVSGSGTLISLNRTDAESIDIPIAGGETYEVSFQFRYTNGTIPTATETGDWNVFGGRKDLLFAFYTQNGTDMAKYAAISADAEGALKLEMVDGIASRSSLIKSGDVYTVVVTFTVPNNGNQNNLFEIPVWMNCALDVDNFMVRNVPGAPTLSGSYIYDKSANQDVVIDVNLHGSTVSKVLIDGVALAEADYTFNAENTKLTIKKEKLASYDVDSVLKVTVESNVGVSNEVTITISDNAPFLTGDDLVIYQPEKDFKGIGLDLNGNEIKSIMNGEAVLDASSYSYDPDSKTLTFTPAYLKTLEGTNDFTVEFKETAVKLVFSVESKVLDVVLAMDFEDDNMNAPLDTWIGTQLPGLAALTQEIVTVDGSKALKINQVPTGPVIFYSTIDNIKMDTTYLYMFGLKITLKQGVPLTFGFTDNGGYTFFEVTGEGNLALTYSNPRYRFDKVDNGDGTFTYDILAFAVPSKANLDGNGKFEIYTTAPAEIGAFDIILDNLIIAKTSYPLLQLDFETDHEKNFFGSAIGFGGGNCEYISDDGSLNGQNSLHYTGGGNFILLRPNGTDQYGVPGFGFVVTPQTTYRLTLKLKVDYMPDATGPDDFPIQFPIITDGGDIGYIRPDPNNPGEPYMQAPATQGFVGSKKVLDAEKNIYELSIVWIAQPGMTRIDFATRGTIDMVFDDIVLEVVR